MRKVENIVREEMNRAGALELLMPGVIPAELWVESGRWEQVRPRAAAPQGSPRARLLPGAHARGSHHRHRAQRAQELPPVAGELLPDPDEVPRRTPAALRRDARARIPHEGRLLLPPRPESRCRRATTPCTSAYTAIFTRLGLKFRSVVADHGRHRRQRLRRIPRARGFRRGRHRLLRRRQLRRESRDGRGRCRPPTPRAAASAAHDRSRHAGAKTIDDVTRMLKLPAVEAGQDLVSRRHRRRRRRAAGARRSRAERRQGAEAAGRRESAAHVVERQRSRRPPAPRPGFSVRWASRARSTPITPWSR